MTDSEPTARPAGGPAVLDEICRAAATLLGLGLGCVVRLDGPEESRIAGAWSTPGTTGPWSAIADLVAGDTALGRAVRGGRATRAGDATAGPVSRALARAGAGAAVTAPIRVGGKPWGVLVVGGPPGDAPGLAQERIVILASLAALAVENIELRGAIADQADEQAALRRVAAAVASDVEQSALFALVAREAAGLCGGDAGRVLRVDPGDAVGVLGSWRAPGLEPPRHGRVAPEGSGAMSAVLARNGPARVDEAPADASSGLRCRIAAPVIVAGAVWGAVVVAARSPASLPHGSERRLSGLAELVALAVAGADTGERIVTEATATIFGGELDMGSTLRAIADSAKRALRADRATCYVHTEDQTRVAAVYTTEADPRLRRFLEASVGLGSDQMPIWGHLLTVADPLIASEHLARDPAIPRRVARALGAGAFLVARLEHASLGDGGPSPLLGTLFVSYATPRTISSRDRLAGRSLAGLAALAIANVRLHGRALDSLARAERLAATDDLTGLANQRAFRERLEMEVARATRSGRPLALVLIDLDHFKRVNDEHGHLVGDRTLAVAAGVLRDQSRREELVARVGGEEFAWVLPEADAEQAVHAAERARKALEAAEFPSVGRLTVSAGVADIAAAGRDPDRLYRLADAALYRAKASGRNTVARWAPPEG